MEVLKEKLNQISGGKILDVGTGAGSFISIFQEYFKDFEKIIGIDNNDRAIEMAQKKFKQDNISFVKMNADKMDFDDCSFDTVCISNTLHHLPNKDEVLNEMKRVLRPGGNFIICEMFCDNQSEKQMSHVILHHLAAEMDMLLGIHHERTFEKQMIIDSVKNIGIDIEDYFEFNTQEEQLNDEHYCEKDEKESLDIWFSSICREVEKLKDNPKYEEYISRIDEYKEKLYKVGMLGATELMVVGRKTTTDF